MGRSRIWEMYRNMYRANLRNALSLITSDKFKEKGYYEIPEGSFLQMLEGGKTKYTKEYLVDVIKGCVFGLRGYKDYEYLKEMEKKYNVNLDDFLKWNWLTDFYQCKKQFL